MEDTKTRGEEKLEENSKGMMENEGMVKEKDK